MDTLLAKNIYKWAYGNDARIAQLEDWQDTALAQIAAGGGKDVVSTSGNGIAVQFSQGKTSQDWFNTLTAALGYISNNQAPSTIRIGIIQ